ncbi:hypothetical protein BLA29_007880, partial [Euroglyphus maynei]
EVFDSAILAGLEYQKNQRHKQPSNNHRHHESNNHQKIPLNDCPQSPFSSRRMPNELQCSHTNAKNPIYQDYGHRHFLPSTPPKLAQISDAKLVSWRKSLTKLSAQEALKSEAAEANHSHFEDDDEQSYYEYHPYYHPAVSSNLSPSNVTTAKLSTFSPFPSPITSPKFPRSTVNNVIDKKNESSSNSKMNVTKSKKINSSKSTKSSSSSTSSNNFNKTNSSQTNCHQNMIPYHYNLLPNSPQKNLTIIEHDRKKQMKNDSSLIVTHKYPSNNKSNHSSSSDYQPSSMLLMTPPSTPMIYHPDSYSYKLSSPQNLFNSPYAMTKYLTPYGTT